MIFTFRLTLTDTPQQFPQVKPKFNVVRLSTPSTNGEPAFLSYAPITAETASTRFAIAKGKEFDLKITDLGLLWAHGTADDRIDMICETDTLVNEAKTTQMIKNHEGGD